MKRNQIRRMIPTNPSDAQMRKAIADLGLPSEDNYDYSEEQARQILNQFRQPLKSERHAQTQAMAHQAREHDTAALSVAAKQQLAGMQQSLERISANRNHAIEQVSDTLAYLYSPATFQADVLSRTAEKLGIRESQSEPHQVLTLDTLSDCFSDFANSVEYPSISPATVAGALPM